MVLHLACRAFILVTAIHLMVLADGRVASLVAAVATTAALTWLLALFLPGKKQR